jgi:very-short-patch-repair endonuclease
MATSLPVTLATAQAGVLHRRQLSAAGLDRRAVERRVRRGELVEIADNVFVVGGTPTTWHQRLWTGLLTARHDAVLSRRTAARLHGHGRFGEVDVDVLEVENTDHRISRAAGHRTSWLPPHHRTVVQGFPVTSPARTCFDLAGMVSIRRRRRGWPTISAAQATRALDDAIVRGLPLADLREVLLSLGKRGRPGTVLFRELLDARGEGFVATESVLEDLLIEVFEARGLPAPSRQHVLGNSIAPIGRVDFVYLDARVVIEADGRQHHSALVDAQADRWRDLELAAAGWVVIRVTWAQLVDEPRRFVDAVERLLVRRTSIAS